MIEQPKLTPFEIAYKGLAAIFGRHGANGGSTGADGVSLKWTDREQGEASIATARVAWGLIEDYTANQAQVADKDTIHVLRDMVDTLNSELHEAVKVAYTRGATDWVRLNYPDIYSELRPKVPENLKLSTTQEKALIYMSDSWNHGEPWAVTFMAVQLFAGIPKHAARRTVRALARKGLAEYVKGFINDEGIASGGSGYAITKEGYAHAMKLLPDTDLRKTLR